MKGAVAAPGARPWAGALAGAVAVAATALLVHFLLLSEPARAAGLALAWTFTVVAAGVLARAAGFGSVASLAAAGSFALLAWLSADTPVGVFVPPLASFGLFLWFFARTLRAGREPLVTSIARFVHGTLTPEIERYTRAVTAAWCVFFAGMAITSAALAAFAPLAVWSLFANLLAYPLVGLMFAAEYAIRLRRFPDFRHVPPAVLVRRIAETGVFGGRPGAT
jgi:uncharacterized membrane protein